MPCYSPLRGWRSKATNENGKRPIVFNKSDGYEDLPVELPCGQCIGCRLERSRQWAVRCVHEASLYNKNCFLTLTYSDDKLPPDGSLQKKDFQKFMKRLRKKFGESIRYFHCGEYGEKYNRPHYHACIFNHDFDDKILWKENNGFRLYTSDTLSKLWTHGYCIIGDVTFESAAYVARYIMKKITGEKAELHYLKTDLTTGELVTLQPEYTTMSRRPGIGKGWYEKYKSDLYPHDKVIINGKEVTIPKFYNSQLETEDPKLHSKLKGKRTKTANDSNDNTLRRLRDREKCVLDRISNLSRNYEIGE